MENNIIICLFGKYFSQIGLTIKTAPLQTLGLGIVAFFTPLWSFFLFLLFFCAFDLITGLYASYIEKKSITSTRLRHTFIKLFIYIFVIVGVSIIETSLKISINATGIITATICLTEFYSILENLERLGYNLGFLSKTIKKIFKKHTDE